MNVRTLVAVATALSCALVAPSGAAQPVSLDGQRRTQVTYEGTVSAPAMSPESVGAGEPSRTDCTSSSCDVTAVRLTLPKGSAGGRFKATVRTPMELSVAVAMYDARGSRVAYTDHLGGNGALTLDAPPYRDLTFSVGRLAAGQYTLVVFDRGGQGTFVVTLDYKANPPPRGTA